MNTIRTLTYEIEIVIWSYVSVERKKDNIHLSELSDIRFSSVTIILAINTGRVLWNNSIFYYINIILNFII